MILMIDREVEKQKEQTQIAAQRRWQQMQYEAQIQRQRMQYEAQIQRERMQYETQKQQYEIQRQRDQLKYEILSFLNLQNKEDLIRACDDCVTVKSRQALNNYTDLKYLKDTGRFADVKRLAQTRAKTRTKIKTFLNDNGFKNRPQYGFVENLLLEYLRLASGYKVRVDYVTSAGNRTDHNMIVFSDARVMEIEAHPEYLISKSEYNKRLKEQAQKELEEKKRLFYDKVNSIIDYANDSKEHLIVKSKAKELDEFVQALFDRTINSIQKIKWLDSEEWNMLGKYIADTEQHIRRIVEGDRRISDYYSSEAFARIKDTCIMLTQSRQDFNDYIDEKAKAISRLFGTRVLRNETQQEDTYNYIRPYKKSITPFTAEVSAAIFSSAENNPIDYIIKYFYPNRSQYKEQIQKLKVLIQELETLKEAKEIIENYKRDYDQYINDVPDYIWENDEDGFYSRLGLTIIDEAVLNVEYKFTYTSGGGMVQRSFTVPMNEETIIELINHLESKLSEQALAKEQRALMTTKLRMRIKERDNYTCCQCGNSVHAEPNLLLEIDHIIPVSKGGLTQEENLQTLC